MSDTDPAHVAYADAGSAWATGAMLAYGPMARHLVDRCPIGLDGARVLDVGAGTGAASDVLDERGADVVAIDLEADMLRHDERRHVAVAGDVCALPCRTGSFDACVAAFVLNHVTDASAALTELMRVTHPGGAILAAVFSNVGDRSKNVIDAVVMAYGYEPPDWYRVLKARAAAVGTTERMRDAAQRAGLHAIDVTEEEIDVALDDPAMIVRYRLGVPQIGQFVAGLEASTRASLIEESIAAVAGNGEPFRPAVIELVARVG